MKILFAASEMVPFSKTGGLADVAGALTKTLSEQGHEVTAVVPFYGVTQSKSFGAEDIDCGFSVPISDRREYGEVFRTGAAGGVTVYFIKKDAYYDRKELYRAASGGDYHDNAERFIFFSKAIIELCVALNLRPDVIHCNDWQTGLIPLYLKAANQKIKTLFTIHNIGYQGLFDRDTLDRLYIPRKFYNVNGIEYYRKISMPFTL